MGIELARPCSIAPSARLSAYSLADGEPIDILDGAGHINFLVGPNNGGKSRLLRKLAGDEALCLHLCETEFSKHLNALRDRVLAVLNNFRLVELDAISEKALNDLPSPTRLTCARKSIDSWEPFYFGISSKKDFTKWATTPNYQARPDGILPMLNQIGAEALPLLRTRTPERFRHAPERIYVPILRGVRRFASIGDDGDPYADLTMQDYFGKGSKPPVLLTGQTIYRVARSMLLGDRSNRDRFREFERTLSSAFFQGKPVTITPREGTPALFIKVGAEAEQAIYNLGDGVQQVLLIAFASLLSQSAFIFIEEPEIHLHPGLQRDLLKYMSNSRQHTYFVTTHSNHFLDMTLDFADMAVYRVAKHHDPTADDSTPTFRVALSKPAELETLRCLGVRNSSVFLVPATIWVEGITDREYLRKLMSLSLRFEMFKEDLHYSFVEYGGSNIEHWSFGKFESNSSRVAAHRLCSSAFLIADRDEHGKHKQRKARLAKELEANYFELPVREIENLLPPRVIAEVINAYEGHDSVSASDLGKYENAPLGQHIEELLRGKRRRSGSYSDESGTVSDKMGFCKKATSILNDTDLTHDRIVALMDRLHAFLETRCA